MWMALSGSLWYEQRTSASVLCDVQQYAEKITFTRDDLRTSCHVQQCDPESSNGLMTLNGKIFSSNGTRPALNQVKTLVAPMNAMSAGTLAGRGVMYLV